MTNGPKIQPALSAQQWSEYRERRLTMDPGLDDIIAHPDPEFPARAIAIANDQLHEADPRKITMQRVNRIREAAVLLEQQEGPSPAWELHRIADVLASYLPRGE
ncbi:MAG: hypothetical protein WEA80_01780 [Gemmatimonadaceae bacterium]